VTHAQGYYRNIVKLLEKSFITSRPGGRGSSEINNFVVSIFFPWKTFAASFKFFFQNSKQNCQKIFSDYITEILVFSKHGPFVTALPKMPRDDASFE
jgi:hypothetical protein